MSHRKDLGEVPANTDPGLKAFLEGILHELDIGLGNLPKMRDHRFLMVHDLETGSFAIKPSVASTTLEDSRITDSSLILLMPKTANAAAALGTTYFTEIKPGQCTVNHANNAQTDRTYRFTVIG